MDATVGQRGRTALGAMRPAQVTQVVQAHQHQLDLARAGPGRGAGPPPLGGEVRGNRKVGWGVVGRRHFLGIRTQAVSGNAALRRTGSARVRKRRAVISLRGWELEGSQRSLAPK